MSKQELVVLGQDADDFCRPGLSAAPLGEDRAGELARVFKALGDPVRLRLLSLIASRQGGEVCVCELTPAFEVSQPTISHHLKLLRQAGLIDGERRGTWVYYRVLPEALEGLAAVLRPRAAEAEA
ncbi:ArsR/SmtB family transcription factor [Streptomyces radicis]|uniref:Transcriptional regulator n=1 Tax=Streptomyces radicis TaxID=1750517 RepID=A0A3A9WBT9_9ACTN|nr:metalloregulator ArsR/SmtB family transcription factor [Streptomyces radicis]RKN10558.1 transcriptional regulator [Streptomyces radicis]RKN24818.1 transcriptional regulator [Streptomyces radicis]